MATYRDWYSMCFMYTGVKTCNMILISFPSCFRGGVGTGRWSLGGDRREDQEARQNSLFPEEVATHHVGHLHRHQGARGQQQRVLPWSRSRSEPAQVQFSDLPAGGKLGQRAQRHTCVNSDPLTRLKKITRERLVSVC